MEKALLSIVLIVALVGVVGLFSSHNFTFSQDALSKGITGNVVLSNQGNQGIDCASCSGPGPVCARLNHQYITYANRCEAECSGAEFVVGTSCNNIPRV